MSDTGVCNCIATERLGSLGCRAETLDSCSHSPRFSPQPDRDTDFSIHGSKPFLDL